MIDMKASGVLHPELSYLIAKCGHTDYFVIADKGFPAPLGVERINLGFLDDMPTVVEVLKAIKTEMIIDRIIITEEMEDISQRRVSELKQLFPDITFETTTHIELKKLSETANGVVKTGDTTPFANLIIVSG